MNEFNAQKQINRVIDGYHHVVILGAGASAACCKHKPEKNGYKIPLMNEIPDVINLSKELKDIPYNLITNNFEETYSKIFFREGRSDRVKKIEQKVFNYFNSLQISGESTIYDYLLLSLRKKDVIATFNWDPLIWQARERIKKFTEEIPIILFLHGNTGIGVCYETKSFGTVGTINPQNGKAFITSQLLYPTLKKDYQSDPFIAFQWEVLGNYLKHPCIVTIFGYSAPASDVDAMELMKKAWGIPKEQQMLTEFEIIDIKSENELKNSWKEFIYSHHYKVREDFFDSYVSQYPRRTGEFYDECILGGSWGSKRIVPQLRTLEDLFEYFKPLLNAEKIIDSST